MGNVTDTKESRIFDCKKDAGTLVTIRVRKANRRELELADMEQSRVYNQALLCGLPPRMRMLRKLREQELWTNEDDASLNSLREEVARLDLQIGEQVKKLEAAPEDAKDEITAVKDGFAKDRVVAFRKLNDLRIEIDGMLGHTSDAKAEDAQRNFLLACVAEYVQVEGATIKVSGRVWDSVEKLMSEQDNNLLQRTIYEQMTFNAGIPSDWTSETKTEDTQTKEATSDATAPAANTSPSSGGNEGGGDSAATAVQSL